MATESNRAPGTELGTTGLNWSPGGYVEEEVHSNLAGRKALNAYKEMYDNDPLVSAIMYAIDMLVRQVPWRVDQGEASEEDAEYLQQCMDDMSHSWADFISEIMSMLPYGFSYHEIVYKRRRGPQPETSKTPSSKFDDGKIGWRKLPIRSQDTLDHWLMSEEGALEGFSQKAPPMYKQVDIPISKSLLFRTRTYKNNPEGRSLLRGAYRPWYFKKRIEEVEGVGIERDLSGFPVFEVPADWLGSNATNDERAYVSGLHQVGKNLRRDKQEYLIWPRVFDANANQMMTEFKLMSSAGQRTFDTTAIIQRYDQRIAMTVLADWVLLGHEKVGSFALSSEKTDVFAVALGTILDVVEDVMNRFAVPRLWRMNGWNEAEAPQIKHGDIEDRDLAALGTFLTTMQQVGIRLFPDPDLEKYVRDVAHLPEKSEETEQLQQQQDEQQQFGEGGEGDDEIRFTDDDGNPIGATGGGGGEGEPPAGP